MVQYKTSSSRKVNNSLKMNSEEDNCFYQTVLHYPDCSSDSFKLIRCAEKDDKFLIDIRQAKLLPERFVLSYTEFRWIKKAFLTKESKMHQLIGKDRILTLNNRDNEPFELILKESDKTEIKITFTLAEFRDLFCDTHTDVCKEVEEKADRFGIPLKYNLDEFIINVYD